ncbi:MAG: DUF2442 domain-containing protein [Rickettsiales bacterium]|jgi:hypothetical protein|nr:DUF2442 domain-containing protein [Rickettsiales bacterium]
MFKHVVDAKYIKNYKVWIAFNDGVEGEINLSEKINKRSGVFEPLKDISYFKNFRIINDTLSWGNGADLAPESLYELVNKQNN